MEQKDFNIETDEAIYFFTPRFYVFDNFSAYTVDIWGKRFLTSEHAYQWKKYSEDRPDLAEQILLATNPSQVKKIADDNRDAVPVGFHDIKLQIMEEILRAKLNQHEKVRERLLETGDREIIENSPVDSFWGIGPNGNGENQVGKIWMKLRDELKTGTDS
jgi:N-glycosidase YbiA